MTGGKAKRVLVFGASGTAGQGAVRALVAAGHDVSCVFRVAREGPDGTTALIADVTRPIQISGAFDVVVSCLASRTGAPKDAWAIDHAAQLNVLNLARAVGAQHFILLSAICVQKPELPFQQAKLAFEKALISSGIAYSIVRPTAFFKSLSGQLDRVRAGKPFLVFGNGALTACKPISDDDLGRYIAGCIDDPARRNRVLPIGGPGAAITPLDQVGELSRLLGHPVPVRRVPVAVLRAIHNGLRVAGRFSPKMGDKAALAQIGLYYATQSMLVWNAETARYDADATPSTGTQTLFAFYAEVIAKGRSVDRGDHAVF